MTSIALCLSGHFRSYEKTFDTLQKSIIGPFNPDIFIFSWENLGFDGVRGDGHLSKTTLDIKKINKLYNPKKILIEPSKNWNATKYISRMGSGLRHPEILFGMFYGVYKSNQLKISFENENNFCYDIVIRVRPDIYFENSLNIDELKKCQESPSIYFPKFGNYSGLNDQFCFGSSSEMNLYSELYNNLDKYFDSGCLWHSETM